MDLLSSGDVALTMEQVPYEFPADWPNFIFQLAAPDVIWHIYSGQRCFKGVLGMDLLSSGDVALTMGKVPCESVIPLKSDSGRMEQLNVVSSYVCISELLSKPLFH